MTAWEKHHVSGRDTSAGLDVRKHSEEVDPVRDRKRRCAPFEGPSFGAVADNLERPRPVLQPRERFKGQVDGLPPNEPSDEYDAW